jgi:WD40 repeat protein
MHRLRSLLSALKPTRLGVLFAVLIGVGVGFWQWGRPPQPRVVLDIPDLLHFFLSPDGCTLAIMTDDPKKDAYRTPLTLWDVQSAKKIELIKEKHAFTIAFSAEGRKLAGNFWNKIRVWDVATGKELETHDNGDQGTLVFSSEGKLLALREKPWTLKSLWDLGANKMVKKLVLEGERIIAEGDRTVLVQSKDIIKVWDLASARICAEIKGFEIPNYWEKEGNPVWPSLTPDFRFLLAHDSERNPLFIFDLINGEKREISTETIWAALAPDGKTVAVEVWQDAPEPSLWDHFLDCLGIHKAPQGPPFMEEGDYFVRLIDVSSGEEIISLNSCGGPSFSADGKTLATSGIDGRANRTSVQIWDVPIRKPVGKILGLAGLAAVATLLAINGLGWLRRRKCSGQPVDSRTNQSSPGTDHGRLEHQAQ